MRHEKKGNPSRLLYKNNVLYKGFPDLEKSTKGIIQGNLKNQGKFYENRKLSLFF